jgi:hypothetical protein
MLKPVGPKITAKSFDFYAATFATTNAGTAYTLESFPALYRHTLIRELRGKFERQELLLMLDVCNGLVLTPGMAGQHLPADVSDGIALDNLAHKWDIDGAAFIAKLRALSIFQLHCLEVWCRAFWEQSGNDGAVGIERWVEQLLQT